VAEAAALRRRLANVHRRLGVESNASVVDRAVLTELTSHPGGLARSLLIRDLGLSEYVVKASLERLERRGKVASPTRGHWHRKDLT